MYLKYGRKAGKMGVLAGAIPLYPMMMLDENSEDHLQCWDSFWGYLFAKSTGNSCRSYADISLKTTNVNLKLINHGSQTASTSGKHEWTCYRSSRLSLCVCRTVRLLLPVHRVWQHRVAMEGRHPSRSRLLLRPSPSNQRHRLLWVRPQCVYVVVCLRVSVTSVFLQPSRVRLASFWRCPRSSARHVWPVPIRWAAASVSTNGTPSLRASPAWPASSTPGRTERTFRPVKGGIDSITISTEMV